MEKSETIGFLSVASAGWVAFATLLCLGQGSELDFEKGRCVGWADAHGRVPAWDAQGQCVLGEYPAQPEDEILAEIPVRLEAYIEAADGSSLDVEE